MTPGYRGYIRIIYLYNDFTKRA